MTYIYKHSPCMHNYATSPNRKYTINNWHTILDKLFVIEKLYTLNTHLFHSNIRTNVLLTR